MKESLANGLDEFLLYFSSPQLSNSLIKNIICKIKLNQRILRKCFLNFVLSIHVKIILFIKESDDETSI